MTFDFGADEQMLAGNVCSLAQLINTRAYVWYEEEHNSHLIACSNDIFPKSYESNNE